MHSQIRAISRLQTHQGKRSPAQNSKADLGLYCWRSQRREGGRKLPQLLLGSSCFLHCTRCGSQYQLCLQQHFAETHRYWHRHEPHSQSSLPPATPCPTQKALPAEETEGGGGDETWCCCCFPWLKMHIHQVPVCELGWDNKI